MNDELIKKVIDLYLSDEISILKIANLLGFGYKKIRNVLLKNNITLRKTNTKGLRKHSNETKYKLSVSKMGEKNPNFNKPVSQKQIELFNQMRQNILNNTELKQEIYNKASRTRIEKELSKGKNNPMSRADVRLKWTLANSSQEPNKKESQLFNILDELYPKKYALNTKGQLLVIDGKIPDIVNIDDNIIFEMYGDYWHRNDTKKQTKERLQLFKKHGYDTYIIWEHELKNEQELKLKISFILKMPFSLFV